jgi:hypothetical protein
MLFTGNTIKLENKLENTPTIPNLIRNPWVRVAGFSGVQGVKEIDSGFRRNGTFVRTITKQITNIKIQISNRHPHLLPERSGFLSHVRERKVGEKEARKRFPYPFN